MASLMKPPCHHCKDILATKPEPEPEPSSSTTTDKSASQAVDDWLRIPARYLNPKNPDLQHCRSCSLISDAIHKLSPAFFIEAARQDELATVWSKPTTTSDKPVAPNKSAVPDRCKKRRPKGHQYHVALSWRRPGLLALEPERKFGRARFELYRPEEESSDQGWAKALLTLPEITTLHADAEKLRFARETLQRCLKEHPMCPPAVPSWLPRRLILFDRGFLRLRETAQLTSRPAYLALSYCWGNGSQMRLLKADARDFHDGVDLTTLPAVVQDFVRVSEALGVAYVWIDALCILQDDDDDWAEHAACMDKIYANALAVVAAVSSESTDSNILGPKARCQRDFFEAATVQCGEEGSNTEMIKARKFYEGESLSPDKKHNPLEYRAWSWQERFLATRCLRFTSHEVSWECNSAECRESSLAFIPRRSLWVQMEDGDYSSSSRTWRSILKTYTHRSLTFEKDRLPAIAGAAARFQKIFRCDYLAGLWSDDMPRGLAWCCEYSNFGDGWWTMFKDSVYHAPSWSWASTPGLISDSYAARGVFVDVPELQVVHFSYKPASVNPFGAVAPGSFIRVKGYAMRCELELTYRERPVPNPTPEHGRQHHSDRLRNMPFEEACCFVDPSHPIFRMYRDSRKYGDGAKFGVSQQRIHMDYMPALYQSSAQLPGWPERRWASASSASDLSAGGAYVVGPVLCLFLRAQRHPTRSLPAASFQSIWLLLSPSREDPTKYERLGIYRMDEQHETESSVSCANDCTMETLEIL